MKVAAKQISKSKENKRMAEITQSSLQTFKLNSSSTTNINFKAQNAHTADAEDLVEINELS